MPRSLLAVVAVALAALIPAAAAQAAPTLTFDQPCYSPGDGMRYSGTGYTPNGDVDLLFSVENRFGSVATKADASGAIAGGVNTPDPDDFVDDDDFSALMGVTANDRVRIEAGGPDDEQSGATSFTLSRFEVEIEQPNGGRVKARKPMQVTAVGYTHARGEMLYVHYTRGGKRVKTLKVGRLAGDCGDRQRTLARALPRGLRSGNYKLVFNTSARSASSTPNIWIRVRL